MSQYPPPPPPGQPGPPGPAQPGQPWPQYGGAGVPPYPPQQQKKRGNGCLIAALVTLGVLLVVCGIGGFAAWRVFDTVRDSVPGFGNTECPTAEDVSDVVGADVELVLDGDIVVAAGCNYSGSGVGVVIVEGSELIADEEIQALRDEAEANGTEAERIDVGEDGWAWGSPQRSEAICREDGLIGVEIFSEDGQEIGDKQDEAVELLEIFIDLQD